MSTEISHHKIELKNGLKLVGEIHPYGNAISMGLAFQFGSRDEESQNLHGAAHMLEHLCFKSTEKYSSFELVNLWESRGGDLNAFTGKEYTCFHAYGLKEDLALGLDLLSQIAFYNNWSAEDLESEKSVVCQEILMSYDNPEDFLFDDFTDRFFAGSSLAHPIFGSVESVSGMQEEDLQKIQSQYYRSDNAILVLTGNFDWDELVSQVEKYFQIDHSAKKKLEPNYPAIKTNSFVHFEERVSGHKHFLMSFPSHSLREGRFFESSVLTNYLSGGMNSLLFQKIREDLALCYQISASFGPNEQVGSFSCYSSTQEENLVELVKQVLVQFKKIETHSISQEQISASVEQIRCGLLLGESDIDARMHSLIYDEIFGRDYTTISDLIDRLKDVSEKSMRAYIAKYFRLKESSFYFYGELSSSTRSSLDELLRQS